MRWVGEHLQGCWDAWTTRERVVMTVLFLVVIADELRKAADKVREETAAA